MFKLQRLLILVALLAIAAYGFIYTNFLFPNLSQRLGGNIVAITTPIVNIFNKPYYWAKNGWQIISLKLQTHNNLIKELERLRQIELQFKKLQEKVAQQQNHIDALNKIVNFVPPPPYNFVTTRVLGAPIGVYFSSLLIEEPNNYPLKKNMVVVGEDGLIGRIQHVESGVARVMLLTDIYSRVPVKLSSTNEQAILVGNGSNNMLIINLEKLDNAGQEVYAKIKIGDDLVTSGIGGVFPPGLPVAKVALISEGKVLAKPITQPQNKPFVMILCQKLPKPQL